MQYYSTLFYIYLLPRHKRIEDFCVNQFLSILQWIWYDDNYDSYEQI